MDDRTLPKSGAFNTGGAYLRREGHEPKATLKRANEAICLVLACNLTVQLPVVSHHSYLK